MDSIWVEKYRPVNLEGLVGNEPAVLRLQGIAHSGTMTHLLLSGPPGIGKTTSLLCLARHLLGDDVKKAVLELNAADERGIDVVRDRIKSFAREVIALPPGKTKIIILDEVDSMTEAAQQALRRLLEVYSDTTRFALACNQSEKVIDPIQSRCAIIRFGRVRDEDIMSVLRKICGSEQLKYDEEALEVIAQASEGDLRKGIGALQAAASALEKISVPEVYKACDMPQGPKLKEAYDSCRKRNWRGAHNILISMLEEGYSGIDILKGFKSAIDRSDENQAIKILSMQEIAKMMVSRDRHQIKGLQIDQLICRLCLLQMDIR